MSGQRKYDKSYGDTLGTDIYYHDPKTPFPSKQSQLKPTGNVRKGKKVQIGSNVPSAMQIYESWMEPGNGRDKQQQLVTKQERSISTSPIPPPTPDKDSKDSKYRYHTDYSDAVPEDEKKRREAE